MQAQAWPTTDLAKDRLASLGPYLVLHLMGQGWLLSYSPSMGQYRGAEDGFTRTSPGMAPLFNPVWDMLLNVIRSDNQPRCF